MSRLRASTLNPAGFWSSAAWITVDKPEWGAALNDEPPSGSPKPMTAGPGLTISNRDLTMPQDAGRALTSRRENA